MLLLFVLDIVFFFFRIFSMPEFRAFITIKKECTDVRGTLIYKSDGNSSKKNPKSTEFNFVAVGFS